MTAQVEDLREVYGTWLESLPWDTFATWTFKYPRGVDRAAEAFVGWLNRLSDRGVDCSVSFWGAEPHPGGHGGHIHSLMRWHPWCSPSVEAIASSVLWRQQFGRCRLEAFRPDAGAAFYLTKYVLKEARTTGTYGIWTDELSRGGVTDDRQGDARMVDGRHGGDVDRGQSLVQSPLCDRVGRRVRSQQETEEAIQKEDEQEVFWKELLQEIEGAQAQEGW